MNKLTRTILPVSMLFLLACNQIPYGYTQEAWERLKREDPNTVQAIEWINSDPTRRRIRKQVVSYFNGIGKDADEVMKIYAEPEMIRGDKGYFIGHMILPLTNMSANPGGRLNQQQLDEIRSLLDEIQRQK